MTTTTTIAGRITGTRLHVEFTYAWKQQRPTADSGPVCLGFRMIDNSTGVSARERRHL